MDRIIPSEIKDSPMKGFIIIGILNKRTFQVEQRHFNIDRIDNVLELKDETHMYVGNLLMTFSKSKCSIETLTKLINANR